MKCNRLTLTLFTLCLNILFVPHIFAHESPLVSSDAVQSSGPEAFVVFSMPDYKDSALDEIAEKYGSWKGGRYAVAVGLNLSYLARPLDVVEKRLKDFLHNAQRLNMPVLVELEGINYWQAYPELWNWWDSSAAGYNPKNRKNVEWYDWTPDSAVRIGWRNWGKQHRVLPMPNLSSRAYLKVCCGVLKKMVEIVSNWQKVLPANQKYLLVGVQLGTEFSIGPNNWYYPQGNSLAKRPTSEDPTTGIQTDVLPSRGVQQTGYAAVRTAGIASAGILTETAMTEAVERYVTKLCRVARKSGLPRNLIFTHGGGWSEGESIYRVANTTYSCPCWSLYGGKSQDPKTDKTAMEVLQSSNAPYWSIGEWLLFGDQPMENWKRALETSFAIPRLRYVQVRHWGGVRNNKAALEAVEKFVEE